MPVDVALLAWFTTPHDDYDLFFMSTWTCVCVWHGSGWSPREVCPPETEPGSGYACMWGWVGIATWPCLCLSCIQTAATEAKDKADHIAILEDKSIKVPGAIHVFRRRQVPWGQAG